MALTRAPASSPTRHAATVGGWRAIVKEVDTGIKTTVENDNERFVLIRKKTKEALLGVRFGLHPVSGQVIVTELFLGYPAQECNKIFVGDVVISVNGVRPTTVDMATQIIKLAEDKVEIKVSNIKVQEIKDAGQRQVRASVSAPKALPAAAAAAASAAASCAAATPAGAGRRQSARRPCRPVYHVRARARARTGAGGDGSVSKAAATAASLLDDLILDDDDFAAAPPPPPPPPPPRRPLPAAAATLGERGDGRGVQHAAGGVQCGAAHDAWDAGGVWAVAADGRARGRVAVPPQQPGYGVGRWHRTRA